MPVEQQVGNYLEIKAWVIKKKDKNSSFVFL